MKKELNNQDSIAKNISTLFLRVAIVGLGLIALLFAVIILSEIYREFDKAFPSVGYLKYLMIGVLGAALVPYFIALHQTMKLLNYIDKNQAFSMLAVSALQKIKYSGFTVCALFVASMPFVYMIADIDDAPGLIIVGAVISGAPMVIAVFTAVLEKLLQSALEMKAENDLTV